MIHSLLQHVCCQADALQGKTQLCPMPRVQNEKKILPKGTMVSPHQPSSLCQILHLRVSQSRGSVNRKDSWQKQHGLHVHNNKPNLQCKWTNKRQESLWQFRNVVIWHRWCPSISPTVFSKETQSVTLSACRKHTTQILKLECNNTSMKSKLETSQTW